MKQRDERSKVLFNITINRVGTRSLGKLYFFVRLLVTLTAFAANLRQRNEDFLKQTSQSFSQLLSPFLLKGVKDHCKIGKIIPIRKLTKSYL